MTIVITDKYSWLFQRVMKEKNVLAERLKSAEAARKRFDEELKRFATENVTREEIRKSLEDEVRRLQQTVGQTEGEKREKEEQVARCEAYIDGMESKLQACEVFASTRISSFGIIFDYFIILELHWSLDHSFFSTKSQMTDENARNMSNMFQMCKMHNAEKINFL